MLLFTNPFVCNYVARVIYKLSTNWECSEQGYGVFVPGLLGRSFVINERKAQLYAYVMQIIEPPLSYNIDPICRV